MIRHCVRQVNGRVPVIGGTGSNCTETAVYLSGEAEEAGVDGLLVVLDDIAACLQTYTVRRYSDQDGNLYFVRAGIGHVYKGFRRSSCPKKGSRRESGIRSLEYTPDIRKAQSDLDKYAQKHHLRLLGEDAFDTAARHDS